MRDHVAFVTRFDKVNKNSLASPDFLVSQLKQISEVDPEDIVEIISQPIDQWASYASQIKEEQKINNGQRNKNKSKIKNLI